MINETKESIFEKDWFTILMLIMFFPVGLFTMFKYKKFNKLSRTIISTICILIIFMPATIANLRNFNTKSTTIVKETTINEQPKTTKDLIIESIPGNIDNVTQVNYVEGLNNGTGSPVVFIMNLKENIPSSLKLKSAYQDAKEIIVSVNKNIGDKITSYQFFFNHPLTNKYGDVEEGKVLSFDLSKETVDKINWDNISLQQLINLSENVFKHPDL